MELFVDIGNSRLKWACSEDNLLSLVQAVNYQPNDFIDILSAQWTPLLPPSNVYISNVGKPDLNSLCEQWCRQMWKLTPIFAHTTKKYLDISNGYDVPQALGVDRWLALIGARPHLSENLCVVDCGTAVTIDVLKVNGLYAGGLILAGLLASRSALIHNAAALKNIELNQLVNYINLAKNTHDGIALGTIYAIAGCIEKVAADHHAQVILTGGDAVFIIPHLKCHFLHLPDLVLQGLSRWANEQPL
jgi:type III pantothenate kinase